METYVRMYRIADSSLYVLSMVDPALYEGVAAKKLWDKLGVGEMGPLVEEITQIWPQIPEEVNNRKWGIKKFCAQFLNETPGAQIVVLGAGLDPKSLDLAEEFPRAQVFDMDMDNMDLKAEMTQGVCDLKNIVFCTANIGSSEQVLSVLRERGWSADQVTLILAEGISYYVPKGAFAQSLAALGSPQGGLILEYSIPDCDVRPEAEAQVVTTAFRVLQEALGMPNPLFRYSLAEIQDLADQLAAQSLVTLNQRDMEQGRKGAYEVYATPEQTGTLRVSFMQF